MNTTTRSKSKSSGFSLFDFSFFGCNRPKGPVSKRQENESFKGLQHPSNCMNSLSGPTKASLNTQSDFNINSLKARTTSNLNDQSQAHLGSDPYPINEVFILGQKEKIIAKVIVRKISEATLCTPSILSSVFGVCSQRDTFLHGDASSHGESAFELKSSPLSILKIESNLSERAGLTERGIQIEGLHDMTPGNVARHIAHRLKCDTIIDALCGYGETSLQFAKLCNNVISIGADTNKNSCAIQSFNGSKLKDKITFVNGELTQMTDLKADVVFLNPSSCYTEKNKECFSLFEHIKPDLVGLLAKSLEITSKVALKLPGNTSLDEVAKLFNLAISKQKIPPARFCVEIEQILNSCEQLEYLLVFFGDCTSMDVKEEYEAAYNYVCCNETFESKANYSYHVISAIIEKVGINRTIIFTDRLREQNCLRGVPNAPVLEGFLDLIIKEKIFCPETLSKLIDEEAKRRSSSLFNITNSYASNLTCRDRDSTLFKNLNNYIEAEKTSYLRQFNQGDSTTPGNPSIERSPKKTMKQQDDQNNVLKWSSSPVPNFQGDLPEPGEHKRVEDSDIDISSYSVATDYLDDLESEEYLGITRSRSVTQVFQLDKGASNLTAGPAVKDGVPL